MLEQNRSPELTVSLVSSNLSDLWLMGSSAWFKESSFIRPCKIESPSVTPILVLRSSVRWQDRGFVKRSASWSCVLTWWTCRVPFWTQYHDQNANQFECASSWNVGPNWSLNVLLPNCHIGAVEELKWSSQVQYKVLEAITSRRQRWQVHDI